MNTIFRFLILCLVTSLPWMAKAQVPTVQDCLGAIPVCQDIYNENNSYIGEGNYPNEINPGSSCLGSGEENDVWYTFTVQAGGMLCFTIAPNNAGDDYDWALFDLTNADCSDIYSDPSLEVSCNYDLTPGPTGANGNGGGQNEPCVPVSAGETFVLNVSNFSGSPFGYTLDFSASSAQIFDPNPPSIAGLTVNGAVNCGDAALSFAFNEDVLCSSVDLADFQLTGPGGPYTINTISGANCVAGALVEDEFDITFSPRIQSTGIFQLKLVAGAGFVEDQCGNIASPGSVSFLVNPVNVNLTVTDPTCPGGSNGSVVANPVNGTPPFDFTWTDGSGNIIQVTNNVNSDQINNLPSGSYTVTINQGCGTATGNIQDPSPFSANPNVVDDDCNQCIGSINPNLSGGTPPYSYNWLDGNSNSSRGSLCAGNYSVTITDANFCDTTLSFTITNLNQPFPDAGIDAQACGLTYQLQAGLSGGTGQWSAAIPGVTFSNTADPNAVVTVPMSGTYTLTWTETINGCSVSDQVNITLFENPVAEAGPDTDVCQLYYQLQANPSVGQGSWTSLTPGVNFAPGPNNPNPFASVGAGGSYTLVWKEDNNGCIDRDTVVITFYNLPPVQAGPNDSICGLTYCLSGSQVPAGATGTWTTNDPSAVFTDANDPNSCVTLSGQNCARFTWTIDYGFCQSADNTLICFVDQPITDAGATDTTCTFTYPLQANPSYGTGTWSSIPVGSSFSNANDPNALATVPGFGDYQFIWREDNAGCVDADTVSIHFFQVPPLSAGVDQIVCNGTVNLSGSDPGPRGNGQWQAYSSTGTPVGFAYAPSSTSRNATVTLGGRPFGCYDFVWEVTYPYCVVQDTVQHCFEQEPIANPGVSSDSVCGLIYPLQAQASVPNGNGYWFSSNPNISFSQPNQLQTDAIASVVGTYTLNWVETNGTCQDSSQFTITFLDAPVSNAGPDQNVCGLTSFVTAQQTSGFGAWTGDSGIMFSNPNGLSTLVDVSGLGYGSYTIIRADTNGICTDADSLEISFFEVPVADAGKDTIVCGNSLILNAKASVGNGLWTASPSLTINQNNQPVTGISITVYGTYELIWKETNGPCSDSDTIFIQFVEQPQSDPGQDTSFCGFTGGLQANASIGQGLWTSTSGLSFGNPSSPLTSVNTSAGYGSYWAVWEEVNGICSDKDSILLEFFEPIQTSIGPDTSLCGLTIQLSATTNVGTGSWSSTSGLGVFSNPNNPSSSFTAVNYGVDTLIWSVTNGACSNTVKRVVEFYEQPVADAGGDKEVCGLIAQIQANASVGQGLWYSPNGVIIQNPTNPSTLIDPGGNGFGTYTVYWSETNGPCTSLDSIRVTFYDDPSTEINCPDSVLYATNPVYYFQDSSRRAIAWYWEFGDGTTSDLENPKHEYTDLGVFEVSLTITDAFGCTGTATCQIEVKDDLRVFVPNAFSPNGDNRNDRFGAVLAGNRKEFFQMDIYDRWGKRVYSTNNEDDWWNGEMPGGKEAKPDVYAVHIQYEHLNGKSGVYHGQVVLIR